MKHSIRVRFTMIFIGLMAAVLLTLWPIPVFLKSLIALPVFL